MKEARPTQAEPASGLKEFIHRAGAPDPGIPTTPEDVAAFERFMTEELEDLDGYDCPECYDTGVNGGGEDCRCSESSGSFMAGVFARRFYRSFPDRK